MTNIEFVMSAVASMINMARQAKEKTVKIPVDGDRILQYGSEFIASGYDYEIIQEGNKKFFIIKV